MSDDDPKRWEQRCLRYDRWGDGEDVVRIDDRIVTCRVQRKCWCCGGLCKPLERRMAECQVREGRLPAEALR